MAHERAQREALRILSGIEDGTMSAADSYALIEDADAALVYLLFTWIRNRYAASHAASDAVIGRLLAISNRYPTVTKKMKDGQGDPVVEWFEDGYTYRDLDSKAFVALIVDKLES